MGVVQDFYDFLEDQGVGNGATGWRLVRRRRHDEYDQLIVLEEDGGPPPQMAAARGLGESALMDPAVQITVRAAPWDGDASEAKAQEIWDLLHGLRCTVIGSTEYMRVVARTSGVIFAGYDERGRPLHTCSYRAMRTVLQPS